MAMLIMDKYCLLMVTDRTTKSIYIGRRTFFVFISSISVKVFCPLQIASVKFWRIVQHTIIKGTIFWIMPQCLCDRTRVGVLLLASSLFTMEGV